MPMYAYMSFMHVSIYGDLSHQRINVTPRAELGFYLEGNHDQHMKSLNFCYNKLHNLISYLPKVEFVGRTGIWNLCNLHGTIVKDTDVKSYHHFLFAFFSFLFLLFFYFLFFI